MRSTRGSSSPFTSSPSKTSSSTLSLKGRALAYLSRREHTRQELCRKLKEHAESAEVLTQLCDELEQAGWLSNARYAEARVRSRASRYGAARLRQELLEAGVTAVDMEPVLAPLIDTELQRAQHVWARKFQALPDSLAERGRQARYLLMRGFSHTIIRQVLKNDLAGVDDMAEIDHGAADD